MMRLANRLRRRLVCLFLRPVRCKVCTARAYLRVTWSGPSGHDQTANLCRSDVADLSRRMQPLLMLNMGTWLNVEPDREPTPMVTMVRRVWRKLWVAG